LTKAVQKSGTATNEWDVLSLRKGLQDLAVDGGVVLDRNEISRQRKHVLARAVFRGDLDVVGC
jgi:hypothetical protein